MSDILIKNGNVWNGNAFTQADVLVADGKIVKLEKDICDAAEFVFDAAGKTVSPGLVDVHVHIKGISSDAFGTNADLSSIPFGVTAVGEASAALGDRALLDSFLIKSRVFVEAGFKDNKACFDSVDKAHLQYGDKVVGIKVYFDKTISEVKDITPLKEVVEYADKNNLIVMVHSSNPPVSMGELLETLRSGDILTHAYHGGINNVSDDDFACIKAAKERGVIIDAGLAGHVHTDFKIFQEAIENGAIPDVISTDITKLSAYKRGGVYGLPMCMSIARHLGMKEEDIFRAVTSAPARALGKEMEWGMLAVGRKADIAVLEYAEAGFDLTDKAGNHIFSDMGYRNMLTISNGEVVYRR